MNKRTATTWMLIFLLSLISCSKLDEHIILNENYLYVADALQYCQGSCNDLMDWENSEILLTGNIPDVTNDSVMLNYYEQSRFYLSDIRNGLFMEIRIVDDKDAIFELLHELGKIDKVYIRGIASSVVVNEGPDCVKGVVITVSQSGNITINL